MQTQFPSDNVPVAESQQAADAEKSQLQLSHPDALSRGNVETQQIAGEDYQYVTGVKLAILLISLTLVFFLVMLDLSIIATVSHAVAP